ncbi:sugar ABC transporter permease [Paenibacillus beijingensis]|uniref:Arabinogalactan ABC transporter permease n=1 Tax=Paenibacillus beijingensis TaxID=1126833 RepID=A0A0D5NGL4_9BACL|nr:sugar ABC transporter permease [Paenibacillus beijingensis]AJY74058.1 arabinogalactan ABC transporter permease [Paenibacillus beijingensis]
MASKTVRTLTRRTFSYIFLAVTAVLCLYPALWVLMSSVRPGDTLFSESLLPSQFTLAHYRDLFTKYPFMQWYANTLKISVISTISGSVLVLMTAYVFSMFRFAGRQNLMSMLLVLGLFPGFMSMIAIYILLNQMNLLNTHLAVIIVSAAGAPLFFLFSKSYFDTIPRSLVEAARIDGAGHLGTFARIVMPLSKPLLVFVILMNFTGPFTDFIFAKLVLRTPEKKTLAVGLYDMATDTTKLQFTVFAAGCVLVAVPITLLFLMLQRYLIGGLTSGADKG